MFIWGILHTVTQTGPEPLAMLLPHPPKCSSITYMNHHASFKTWVILEASVFWDYMLKFKTDKDHWVCHTGLPVKVVPTSNYLIA